MCSVMFLIYYVIYLDEDSFSKHYVSTGSIRKTYICCSFYMTANKLQGRSNDACIMFLMVCIYYSAFSYMTANKLQG
jgi:hypothetical protein